MIDWVDRHLPHALALIVAGRIVFLFGCGLELIGDETYYWDWTRRLDWCYYSKPPMVAWWIAASTTLFGHHAVAVRLPAVILGAAFLAFFYATAKEFADRRTATVALLLVLATPAQVLANLLMTIDAPLLCFWVIAVFFLQRAVFTSNRRAWLLAGCASAAALLSKQTAVALPLASLAFLLTEPRMSPRLRSGWVVYFLPIVVALLPLLWWNVTHDWVMLGHTQGHFRGLLGAADDDRSSDLIGFVALQALLLSPITFALALWVTVRVVGGWRRLSPRQRLFGWLGPLPLLAILGLACLQKIEGNWPLPFVVTTLMLLADAMLRRNQQRALFSAIALGSVLVLLTYALPWLVTVVGWRNGPLDPTRRMRGWGELAARVESLRHASGSRASEELVVTVGHRYLTSELAFCLPDQPVVFRFEPTGRAVSQYELWNGPRRAEGKDAIVVVEGGDAAVPPALRTAFSRFTRLAEVDNPRLPRLPLVVYRGEELQAWPVPVSY